MTSAHIFFIPGMIMVGMVIGFVFGARAARNQMDLQKRRDADREAARAARAAKREAAKADDDKAADKAADDKAADDKPADKADKKKAKA